MSGSSRDYYRELMARADIVAVAAKVLDGRCTGTSGVELTYDCPRHESKSKRSLTVNAEKGVWHCWGCDKGGDALQLIEFVRTGNIAKGRGTMPQSHRDARDELAGIVGMPLMSGLDLTEEQRAELEARHQEREQVFDALTQIGELYHRALLDNPEVLDWVREKYGFDRAQVEQFTLGWADDPDAAGKLRQRGLTDELLVKTGAFVRRRGWLRPFFSGRLVLPYFDRGRVAYLIGRQTPWTPQQPWEHKYKKLPVYDAKRHPHVSQAIDNSLLWGESCLASRPKLLLITEGITDAMAATATGVSTISPVTTRVKRSDLERALPQLREIERVVLMMDNELSAIGGEAAMDLAEQLRAEGVTAFVAELPLQEAQEVARAEFAELLGEDGLGRFQEAQSRDRKKLLEEIFADRPEDRERADQLLEAAKIDVAEWFRGGGTVRQFRRLLEEAPSPLEIRIDRLGEASELDDIREVLEQIAPLSPVERERLLKRIKDRTGLTMGTLRKEIEPEAQAADRARTVVAEDEGEDLGPLYEATPQGLVWNRRTNDGVVPVPLTNFLVEITATIIEDDGQETSTRLELEATVSGQKKRFTVAGRDFNFMAWVVDQLGAKAVLFAGASIRDHARVAIQTLSSDSPVKHVYTHTGWRKIDGPGWCYINAGGPIGAEGAEMEVSTSLHGALERYKLPEPPQGEALLRAGRVTLELLELGPDRIILVLLAATFRAVLSGTDVTLHLAGESGTFKTSTGLLFQAFWGAELATGGPPASWSSTGNSLEALAFLAKDALLLVDDFCPTGSPSDVQRYHREADRLIRAQGNHAGRGRCSSDGNLRRVKWPRGTIVSTGEDVPVGHSLRARMFVIEFSAGDISKKALTERQRHAADGVYARLMAAFIRWVAGQRDEILSWLERRVQELRAEASNKSAHSRTPTTVAELMVGFEVFLSFAESVGLLDKDKSQELRERCWAAVGEVAQAQVDQVASSEPTTVYFTLLAAALASGEAHIAGADGLAPDNAEALGWRLREGTTGMERTYAPQGTRVGWIRGDDLYLELTASYKAAQRMASGTDGLSVTPRTLSKRLATRGFLKSSDPGKYTARVHLEGARRFVLHLDVGSLLFRSLRRHRDQEAAGECAEADSGPESWRPNGREGVDSEPTFGASDRAGGGANASPGADGSEGAEMGEDTRNGANGEEGDAAGEEVQVWEV